MSMNRHPILYSLIGFVIAIFFIVQGMMIFLVTLSQKIRIAAFNFMGDNMMIMTMVAVALVLVGIALLYPIYIRTHRRYYHIQMGKHVTSIDKKVVDQYLNSYWKKLFPNKSIPNSLSMKADKIFIAADLPSLPLDEQKEVIEKVEQDLCHIFTNILGYRNPLLLSISFVEPQERDVSSISR